VRTLRLRQCAAGYRNKMVPEGSGMPPAMFRRSAKPLSGDIVACGREELAILRVQARECGRSPGRWGGQRRRSRGSCDAMRDAQRGPGLSATTAQWHATGPLGAKACEAGDQRGAASVCADRLAGVVVTPRGAAVPGPAVSWKGRRTDVGRIGGGLGVEPEQIAIAYGSTSAR